MIVRPGGKDMSSCPLGPSSWLAPAKLGKTSPCGSGRLPGRGGSSGLDLVGRDLDVLLPIKCGPGQVVAARIKRSAEGTLGPEAWRVLSSSLLSESRGEGTAMAAVAAFRGTRTCGRVVCWYLSDR